MRTSHFREYILNVSSIDRAYLDGSSSCNFTVNLPNTYRNIFSSHVIGGIVPSISTNFNNPYLYLVTNELRSYDIQVTNQLNSVSDILYIDHNTTTGNIFDKISNSDAYTMARTDENFKQFSSLGIKIYNKTGQLHTFGNDILNVLSFSNASPTTITTSINHNLVNGMRVYFRQFVNGTTLSVNNLINSQAGHVVTVTGLNTFTIPVDLTSQSANQYKTGITAFTLGAHSVINFGKNNVTYTSSLGWTNANPTEFNLGSPHGLSNGQLVRISGFDNGSTTLINTYMNMQYPITVTGLNTFTIPYDLSGELPSQPLTNNSLSVLGSGSFALVDALQTSLDFKLIAAENLQ